MIDLNIFKYLIFWINLEIVVDGHYQFIAWATY